MFLAVSQQNSGTKVQTGTKEQEQVQGYFLPPYGERGGYHEANFLTDNSRDQKIY